MPYNQFANALRMQPESNPDMLASAIRKQSRQQMEHLPFTPPQGPHPMDLAAMSTMFLPGIGDVIGTAADARMLYQEPESRTPLNIGLAALGALPLVPSLGMVKAFKKSKSVKNIPDVSYRGGHTAPLKDYGAPGHAVNKNIYPDDIYGPHGAQYYGHYGQNNVMDVETINKIRRMRGNPDATVTIYRAVPESRGAEVTRLKEEMRQYMRRGTVPDYVQGGFSGPHKKAESNWYDWAHDKVKKLEGLEEAKSDINPGDWVTINKKYAIEHGESNLGSKYEIIQKKVKAKDIYTDGNSIHEWGYDP